MKLSKTEKIVIQGMRDRGNLQYSIEHGRQFIGQQMNRFIPDFFVSEATCKSLFKKELIQAWYPHKNWRLTELGKIIELEN